MSNDSNNDFAAMFEQSLNSHGSVPMGEKVQAKVVSIGKEHIYLDLGIREDGLLQKTEMEVDGELTVAVGDTITVLPIRMRDGAVTCASRVGAAGAKERSGDKDLALATLQEAYESNMPVEGNVKEVIKGGFSVTLMGLRAFCPISQIDNSYCETPEEHVGHSYSFVVIELDGQGRNIVVSRRKLLEVAAEELAKETWGTLEVGAVHEGVVSNVRSYGAFVDIGGVEGLLHVSEISYERVDDPNDHLSKGQRVRVAIKTIDPDQKRIALSMRMLAEDPWVEASHTLEEGQILEGQVVRLTTFGAFVEIQKGVEGLVHISEMGGGKRLHTPHEVVTVGDNVSVKVLSVDPDSHRISLSMNDAADAEAIKEETERKADFKARSKAGQSLGTFGDLLGKHLKK